MFKNFNVAQMRNQIYFYDILVIGQL